MALETELLALERRFWSGDADFYRRHLDERCLTAFADLAGVIDREALAGTVGSGGRWRDLDVDVKGCLQPRDGVALLTYEAHARRPTGEPYAALVTSGYVRRGREWKLAFHQQTPLADGGQPAERPPEDARRAQPRPSSDYEVEGREPEGIGTKLGIDEPPSKHGPPGS